MDQPAQDQMFQPPPFQNQDGSAAIPGDITQMPGANGLPPTAADLSGQINTMPSFIPDASVNLMTDPTAMAAMGMHPDQASLMMQSAAMMGNGHAPVVPQQDATVSADEIALYDRQIRLWGMAAQAKIQSANILLITIRALANEIAKNLVLAGIGSLTILDGSPVTKQDLGAQFFLSEDDHVIGQNRAQAASVAIQQLNPRVRLHVDTEGVKSKGPSYFASFDIVIATDLDPDSFNLINTATRLHGKSFYATGSHGMYGFVFSDLIEHDFVIQRDLGNVPTTPGQETRTRSVVDVKTRKEGPKTIEMVSKRELYSTWFLASDAANLPEEYLKSKRRLKAVTPALSCLRALWEFMQLQRGRMPSTRDDLKMFTQLATQKHKALGLPSETLRPEFLRSFLQNLGSEVAPVTAILGGQLAQDVINVLGQTQQPIQNMVILDGNTMEAPVYSLHPEGVLGASLLSLTGTETIVPNGNGLMVPDMTMNPTGMPMNGGFSTDPAALQAMPLQGAVPMPMPIQENLVPPTQSAPDQPALGQSAPDQSAPSAEATNSKNQNAS